MSNIGCWNFFSALDLYGAYAQLGILGKQKFSSLVGIAFTLIAGVFTIGYLFLEISELVTKQQPQMVQSDHQVIETSAFPLLMDNFTLAITVADINIDPLKTINSYFTITVQNCKRTRHINNVTNTVEVKNECVTYQTEACSAKHFITDIQKQYFNKIRLGAVQCIQQEIQQNNPPVNIINYIKKLQGLVSGNTYSYITIKFSICKNTTTNQQCAPIEKIHEQLMKGYYALHLSDSLLQMNKVGNIQQQIIKMQFTTFSVLSSKTIFQGFRVIESNTDVGSVTTDIQQDLFLIQQSYRESTSNYNDDFLVFHYIILDEKYSQYQRSYTKLLTVLSKIGGLWQLIFLIFGFISKPFILTEMKINLSNQLFRFQHEIKQELSTEKNLVKFSEKGFFSLKSKSTKDHFDNYMNSNSFKFPNSFKDIFLLSFGCKRDRAKQLNSACEKMSEKLDVVEIVQKLLEFDKFKYILFTNDQRILFDFIPKPLIKFKEGINDLQIRESKSITLDVEMDKKKEGYDKFMEVSKAFQKIKQSSNNLLVDKKIIQYLDTEFIRLFNELNNDVREHEKEIDSMNIEVKLSQYQKDQIVIPECFTPKSIGAESQAAKIFINKLQKK